MDSIASTATFDPALDRELGGTLTDTDAALTASAAAQRDAAASTVKPSALALAAGAGAAAAAVVGLALYFFMPPQHAEDLRVPAISRDIEALKLQLATMTDKLRALETGAVSTIETTQALDSTVRAQATALASVQKDLAAQADAVKQRWEDQNRLATPALMGVAVVQLREALERGGRFDWELVNLWGIAGRTPVVAAELARLAPLARGVQPEAEIKAQLQVLAAQWDYSFDLVRTGLGMTGWLVGIGSGSFTTHSPNSALMYRAVDLLERGNYAAATRELQKASADVAGALAPIIAAVKDRATAFAACGRLMVMARTALEAQGQTLR